ncbi:hypothetical protein VCHENC02_5273, partial [Vibrio harveyi]
MQKENRCRVEYKPG